MNRKPIGVFDSGLGGLTVLKELHKALPNEDLIYFGDNGRTPYGTKSKETVIKYTHQDINFLLKQDVKMIVIACNTVSACSYDIVTKEYDIPIIEVVGPGARAAVRNTREKHIGVIATPATIGSGVYEKAIKDILPDAVCSNKACPMFVPLVEEGWWDNEITEAVAEKYLGEMKQDGVDTLVLGCTHYPMLTKVLGRVMGDNVTLINSASVVAEEAAEKIKEMNLANDKEHLGKIKYFTSDSAEKFKTLAVNFMNEEIDNAEKIYIEKESVEAK